MSHGCGGHVSDKEITLKSRFLDYLQHGDCILADFGLTITEELASYEATLKIPHFTKGKTQMSGKEVDASRKISNVRIHVETATFAIFFPNFLQGQHYKRGAIHLCYLAQHLAQVRLPLPC